MKKNKTKKIITIVSIILSAVMLFSVISFMPSKVSIGKAPAFGGIRLIRNEFTEALVFENKSDFEPYPGVFLENGSVRYGAPDTDDGYFRYSTDEFNTGDVNSYMGFYLRDSQTTKTDGLYLSKYDYITIDFDMWSDTTYFSDMKLKLDVRSSNGGFACGNDLIRIQSGPVPSLLLNGEKVRTFNGPYDINHLTWVISINNDNLADSYAYLYVDGKYVCVIDDIFTNSSLYISNFRLETNSGSVALEGTSICFDNFEVNAFGDGGGDYKGELTSLFADPEIRLENCIDSILYNGN